MARLATDPKALRLKRTVAKACPALFEGCILPVAMMPDMRLRGDRRSLGKLVSPAVNVEKEQASEPSKKRPRKSDANKRVSFGQVHVTYLEKDNDTPSRNTSFFELDEPPSSPPSEPAVVEMTSTRERQAV